MEDILASIRRILSEDEAPGGGRQPTATGAHRRRERWRAGARSRHDGGRTGSSGACRARACRRQPAAELRRRRRLTPWLRSPRAAPASGLVAPEAAAAAAFSVEGLVRTLTERTTRVRSGGPTIEDIVREEMRPLLKSWLDANLPPLVERLVRVEIERVVGRVVP